MKMLESTKKNPESHLGNSPDYQGASTVQQYITSLGGVTPRLAVYTGECYQNQGKFLGQLYFIRFSLSLD